MLPPLAAFDDADHPAPEPDEVPHSPPHATAPERPGPPASPAPPSAPERSGPQRFVLALLLIAAAALIGYVLSRPGPDEAGPDAIARSVAAADQLQLVLDTDDAREAQRFVRDEFGWRVGLPLFGEASLRGVAVAQVAPAVEVPVFLYGADAREVAVFAYSYALFDQVPDRLRLAVTDYDDLAGGDPVLRRTDDLDVLLWRDRDDIYVAVTTLPPDDLRAGLTMVR